MKTQIRPVYHLHIPRTSGTNLLYEAQRASKLSKEQDRLVVYTPGSLEFDWDKSRAKECNYISGHFATNPIYDLKNPVVFSLVRNPIDQCVSAAAYRALTDNREFTSADLDKYIDGYYVSAESFPGFDGTANCQSHFLFSRLVKFELSDGFSGMVFDSFPNSVYEVLESVEDMVVGTLENREHIINEVNTHMRRQFGVELKNNTNRVNSTPKMSFSLSSAQRARIENKNWIDVEVYRALLDNEARRKKKSYV